MKNSKGITLIALTITIIVIIIIASVGTYGGMQALKDSKEDAQIAEVGMIQQAILENYTKYKTTGNDKYLVGKKIEDYNEVLNVVKEINSKSSEEPITLEISEWEYQYVTYEGHYYELNNEDLENLGIIQEENIFIVNYATGEVINKTLLTTKKGKPLYVYAQQIPVDLIEAP